TFVPVFVAVIVTPGIKALDGSATVPPTEALIDCPNPFTERNKHSSDTATAYIDRIFILHPPLVLLTGANSIKPERNKQSPTYVKLLSPLGLWVFYAS